MPRLDEEDLQQRNVGTFGFSGVRVADLGATEYTLVDIVVDCSGSTAGFTKEMEDCLKTIVKACQKSPRADNLLIRVVRFDNNLDEVHGFKLLSQCSPDDYNGALRAGGSTALFDATVDGIEAVSNFGKELLQNDFDVNAALFVITDGMDNQSTTSPLQVNKALAEAVTSETLESLISVLIAIESSPGATGELDTFFKTAGFTQYVKMPDASTSNLAKLAQFVSKSISSQSQNLGTGAPAPSQSISF